MIEMDKTDYISDLYAGDSFFINIAYVVIDTGCRKFVGSLDFSVPVNVRILCLVYELAPPIIDFHIDLVNIPVGIRLKDIIHSISIRTEDIGDFIFNTFIDTNLD